MLAYKSNNQFIINEKCHIVFCICVIFKFQNKYGYYKTTKTFFTVKIHIYMNLYIFCISLL